MLEISKTRWGTERWVASEVSFDSFRPASVKFRPSFFA